jgi:hypothetical protein
VLLQADDGAGFDAGGAHVGPMLTASVISSVIAPAAAIVGLSAGSTPASSD